MTGLEIALFILGVAFIVISFFIVDNSKSGNGSGMSASSINTEAIRRIGADAIEDMNRKSDLLIAESEDKLETISNDKIIAVGEYSDQVLEKINSNHKEVVFLYQMLTDKEEELKSTAMKLDNIRIECEKLIKSEVALEVQRSNDNAAGAQMRVQNREPEPERIADDPVAQSLKKVLDKISKAEAGEVTDEPADAVAPEETVISEAQPEQPVIQPPKEEVPLDPKEKALEDARRRARAAAKERSKAQTQQAQPQAARPAVKHQPAREPRVRRQTVPVEAEGRDNRSLSRNEEIISLHKQGKSVMEISKLLSMGQGEVRLIINLYG